MVIPGSLKMGTNSLTLFPLTGEIYVPSLGITVGPVTAFTQQNMVKVALCQFLDPGCTASTSF